MFKEFLGGKLFKASAISTERKKWLAIDEGDAKPAIREAYGDAKNLGYDNLPVTRGNKIRGYVKVDTLKGHDFKLQNGDISAFEDWRIDYDTSYPEVAKRVLSDGVEEYKLYFVAKKSKPVGLITYADLNRRSVYVYCFTQVLFVEQWIKKKIEEKYQMKPHRKLGDGWAFPLRTKKMRKGSRFDLLKTKAGDRSLLNVCGLDDLLYVASHDKKLHEAYAELKPVAPFSYDIRNKVAHPVRLLVRADRARTDIEKLVSFWGHMDPFIQRHDFNEKNGGWPVNT